jgi:large subunit ribosomal protein L22
MAQIEKLRNRKGIMSLIESRSHLDKSKTAYARDRSIRVSPSKLSLVTDMIKGMHVEKALLQLQYSKKGVAKTVYKVLNSAIANAENNHLLDVDSLYVSEVLVGKSFLLKRFMARAKGRPSKVKKLFSDLIIFVSSRGSR